MPRSRCDVLPKFDSKLINTGLTTNSQMALPHLCVSPSVRWSDVMRVITSQETNQLKTSGRPQEPKTAHCSSNVLLLHSLEGPKDLQDIGFRSFRCRLCPHRSLKQVTRTSAGTSASTTPACRITNLKPFPARGPSHLLFRSNRSTVHGSKLHLKLMIFGAQRRCQMLQKHGFSGVFCKFLIC